MDLMDLKNVIALPWLDTEYEVGNHRL